jgi:hypothetical protein
MDGGLAEEVTSKNIECPMMSELQELDLHGCCAKDVRGGGVKTSDLGHENIEWL